MSILHKLESIYFTDNFDEKKIIPEGHITELLKVISLSGFSSYKKFETMVIHNKETQSIINGYVSDNVDLKKASHLFVFLVDNSLTKKEREEVRDQIFMAIQSILLAAQDMNINVYFSEKITDRSFKNILNNERQSTQAIILLSLGYGKDYKKNKNKNSNNLNETVILKY
jgi:hypothetical protein